MLSVFAYPVIHRLQKVDESDRNNHCSLFHMPVCLLYSWLLLIWQSIILQQLSYRLYHALLCNSFAVDTDLCHALWIIKYRMPVDNECCIIFLHEWQLLP